MLDLQALKLKRSYISEAAVLRWPFKTISLLYSNAHGVSPSRALVRARGGVQEQIRDLDDHLAH